MRTGPDVGMEGGRYAFIYLFVLFNSPLMTGLSCQIKIFRFKTSTCSILTWTLSILIKLFIFNDYSVFIWRKRRLDEGPDNRTSLLQTFCQNQLQTDRTFRSGFLLLGLMLEQWTKRVRAPPWRDMDPSDFTRPASVCPSHTWERVRRVCVSHLLCWLK